MEENKLSISELMLLSIVVHFEKIALSIIQVVTDKISFICFTTGHIPIFSLLSVVLKGLCRTKTCMKCASVLAYDCFTVHHANNNRYWKNIRIRRQDIGALGWAPRRWRFSEVGYNLVNTEVMYKSAELVCSTSLLENITNFLVFVSTISQYAVRSRRRCLTSEVIPTSSVVKVTRYLCQEII